MSDKQPRVYDRDEVLWQLENEAYVPSSDSDNDNLSESDMSEVEVIRSEEPVDSDEEEIPEDVPSTSSEPPRVRKRRTRGATSTSPRAKRGWSTSSTQRNRLVFNNSTTIAGWFRKIFLEVGGPV
uniref:uncharacterized protein LOC120331129 n=1 Tax=Styela clava TaxID=7725 RepID=UPI001939AF76|nr:uncharacterized protein LOC120331129 [Styela clava]